MAFTHTLGRWDKLAGEWSHAFFVMHKNRVLLIPFQRKMAFTNLMWGGHKLEKYHKYKYPTIGPYHKSKPNILILNSALSAYRYIFSHQNFETAQSIFGSHFFLFLCVVQFYLLPSPLPGLPLGIHPKLVPAPQALHLKPATRPPGIHDKCFV